MLQTSTQLLKLAVPFSQLGIARFCSYHSKISFHKDHFTPFSKEKTVKGLHLIQESLKEQNSVNAKNLLKLDPLSETSHSETYRVFDRYHKKFFAQKTIRLDSLNAWEQLNFSLKQYTDPTSQFAKIVSIDYNEGAQEAKVYSELHQKLVGDYSYFRNKNRLDWTNKELESLTWQLASQMNGLRHLDAKTNSLGGMKMFIDEKTHSLKLFEYSELKPGSEKLNMDAVVYSLVQIMNPYIMVHNAEEARSYLKNNYPEFFTVFQRIEKVINESGNTKAVIKEIEKHLLNEPILHDQSFHKFVTKLLVNLVKERKQGDSVQDAGLILQGLGEPYEALKYLQDAHHTISWKFGEQSLKASASHLYIAALNRELKNFEEAIYHLDTALTIEKKFAECDYERISKIHNEYGKIYSEKGKFSEALKKFQEAEQALNHKHNPCSVLKKEIQKNIRLTKLGEKIDAASYSAFEHSGERDGESTGEKKKEVRLTEMQEFGILGLFVLLLVLLFNAEEEQENSKKHEEQKDGKAAKSKKEMTDQEALKKIVAKEKKQQAKKIDSKTEKKTASQEVKGVCAVEEKTNEKSKAPVFFFFLFASLGVFGLAL